VTERRRTNKTEIASHNRWVVWETGTSRLSNFEIIRAGPFHPGTEGYSIEVVVGAIAEESYNLTSSDFTATTARTQ
jgi:hypothetical protein